MRNRSPRAVGKTKVVAKKLQFRRLIALTLFLALAFAGLGYRLVDLQVLRHADLKVRARQNTKKEFLLNPRRGDILDARGNLLATSVPVKTVCADPTLIGNQQAIVARTIAPLLQVNEGELYQKLLPRTRVNEKGQTVTNQYIRLKQKVSVENWQRIQDAMGKLSFGVDEKSFSKAQRNFVRDLRLKAIFTDPIDDQQRIYPNQTLAAHVLGFVSSEESEWNGKPVTESVGKEGIEFSLNSKLAGVSGWRITETDRRNREMLTLRDQDVEPHHGLNVVLTIDSVIQHAAEGALAEAMQQHSPVSASAIVLRPRTGEILAMATLPNFDPNNPGANANVRRNRVVTDFAEPGSTFKIVVVSGALNDRIVKLNDAFDCEHGHFSFAGRVLHDHEAYGVLTVESIITKSSNIGAAKIGIQVGAPKLYQYMRDFGFGERTGIPLPGETPGMLSKVDKWSKVSIAQIPMGHGIAITPLQMVMAMSAIANNGVLMRPMIVDRLEDEDRNVVAKYSPQQVRRVISEAAVKQMVTALKTVVTPEGTAPKAAMEHYTVAGKTGTAQKAERGVYVPGKYFSSFIGFFPADNPELCISIVMDEPKEGYYGGQVAAPIFKQIAERAASYLNIRPDKNGDDNPQTLAGAGSNVPFRTASVRAP